MLFSKLPLSPNAWTVLSLLPAVAGLVALLQKQMLAALALFIASAFLDAVDGAVARVTGRATALGAYLDGIADRFVEAMLLIGLMLFGIPDFVLPGYAWAALLLFAGTCMTSFARAYAVYKRAMGDGEAQGMGGLLERAERLALVFAGMLLHAADALYLTYAIAAAFVLALATTAQRIFFVLKSGK
jgi:phosphatidylglycerophosphate synthase